MKSLFKAFLGTILIIVAITMFMLFSFGIQDGIKPNELITYEQYVTLTFVLSVISWVSGIRLLSNKQPSIN